MKSHFRPSFESLEARENTSTLSLASSALPIRPATSSTSASLVHEDTHAGETVVSSSDVDVTETFPFLVKKFF